MTQLEFIRKHTEQEKAKRLACYTPLNTLARKGQILFAGSSLMEWFPVCEIAASRGVTATIYNRGVAGFTTAEMLAHMDTLLLDLAPSRLFINIGTNDIRPQPDGAPWKPRLLENYRKILAQFRAACPDCTVYVLSYYPVNPGVAEALQLPGAEGLRVRTNAALLEVNRDLEAMAAEMGCRYLDVNDGLRDETGALKADYTMDGLHMYPAAYFRVFDSLRAYLD